jgi:aspartate/methionine/tyrosine aminotransferase
MAGIRREGSLAESSLPDLTATFGALVSTRSSGIDLGLGSVRDVDALRALWGDVHAGGWNFELGDYPGTQGTVAFAQAVADLVAAECGESVEPTSVLATHGALDAIAHALGGIERGSRAAFATPGFPVSLAIFRAGLEPMPIRWRPHESLTAFLDRLEGHRERPAAVVLSLPSNPAGTVATLAEWTRLVTIAESGTRVVVDAVYRFLDPSPWSVTGFLDAGGVLVDSASKRLGAPGLRLGWLIAHDILPVSRKLAAGSTVGVSVPVVALGTEALRQYVRRDLGPTIRDEFARRRRDLCDGAGGTLSIRAPSTGFFALVELGTEVSPTEASLGLQQAGLIVAPSSMEGVDIGRGDPDLPYLRLSLGGHANMRRVAKILVDTVGAAERIG